MKNKFSVPKWKQRQKVYKDDYKRGLGCPKLMWLMRHRFDPDLQAWAKNNLTFLDKEEKVEFESNFQFQEESKNQTKSEIEGRLISGIWFEKLVASHFAQKYRFFEFPKYGERLSAEETTKILADRSWDVFWHPAFTYQNYTTEVDFLKRNGDGFDLYEVKCLTNITPPKVKNNLLADFIYQYWILKKLGYQIQNVYLIYLDKEYYFKERLETKRLIKITHEFNVPQVKTKNLETILKKCEKWIKMPFSKVQKWMLTSECEENNEEHCTHIVGQSQAEYKWLELYRCTRKQKAKFFFSNPPEALDLEKTDLKSQKLTNNQCRQIRVIQNLECPILSFSRFEEVLKPYQFPIYFYDFETSQIAIPQFAYATPYLQIPFQYSIHVLLSSDYDLVTKKNVVHYQFIAQNRLDPRRDFLENFTRDIQRHGPGSYVAYNTPFERTILKNLLNNLGQFFSAETQKITTKIIDESLDLMDFFRDFNIYHKNFHGSLSIKKTLPALCPEFNYQNLTVQTGDQASNFYFNYLHSQLEKNEWVKKQAYLLEYCALDTWGMVVLFEQIKALAKKYAPQKI